MLQLKINLWIISVNKQVRVFFNNEIIGYEMIFIECLVLLSPVTGLQ